MAGERGKGPYKSTDNAGRGQHINQQTMQEMPGL